MPYAIVIEAAAASANLRSIHGAMLQGAFLNLARRIDPALSEHLHAGNELRAYALSLLSPPLGKRCDNSISTVRLRVACLDDRVYPALLQAALGGDDAVIQIGHAEFRISRLLATKESGNGWAGYASFEDVIHKIESADDDSEFVELEFRTPTVFRQGSRDEVLPAPELVFGGLARRWNAAPNAIKPAPESLQENVREYVTISRFFGETLTVDIGDGLKKTGFVGRVVYRIHHPAVAYWCRLLAEAAFFSGLGAKTSRGLGCIRRI